MSEEARFYLTQDFSEAKALLCEEVANSLGMQEQYDTWRHLRDYLGADSPMPNPFLTERLIDEFYPGDGLPRLILRALSNGGEQESDIAEMQRQLRRVSKTRKNSRKTPLMKCIVALGRLELAEYQYLSGDSEWEEQYSRARQALHEVPVRELPVHTSDHIEETISSFSTRRNFFPVLEQAIYDTAADTDDLMSTASQVLYEDGILRACAFHHVMSTRGSEERVRLLVGNETIDLDSEKLNRCTSTGEAANGRIAVGFLREGLAGEIALRIGLTGSTNAFTQPTYQPKKSKLVLIDPETGLHYVTGAVKNIRTYS